MRLALIGYGNIATTLLGILPERLEALTLLCRAERITAVQTALTSAFPSVTDDVAVVSTTNDLLARHPDLVIECAGHSAVQAHGAAVLQAGIDLVLVSIGALADGQLEASLRQAAETGRARLVLPAGAIGGVDLLSSLRPAGPMQVTYRGVKPPAAWAGSPAEQVVDLTNLRARMVFFDGTARQAASAYPKNANVAATLAMAGAGFDQTQVQLIADPAALGNMHEYSVNSPVARFTMQIENLPSAGNAKTSVSTVYSVLREITNRMGPVAI